MKVSARELLRRNGIDTDKLLLRAATMRATNAVDIEPEAAEYLPVCPERHGVTTRRGMFSHANSGKPPVQA